MKKLVLAATLCAATSATFAESQPGFSAELLFGTADQESDFTDLGGEIDGDDTSVGLRGAYQFNKNFAIELAYKQHGTIDESESYSDSFDWMGEGVVDYTETYKTEIETKSIDLGFKGMIPLNDSFSLIGRVGITQWDYELTAKYSYFERYTDYTDSSFNGTYSESISDSEDDSGTDFYYGIGIQYEFNEHIFAGFEYTITQFDASIGSLEVDQTIKNMSLSLGYKF
ncbi:porin family protein [Dasania marina]|uniref:porin family protein n=1 Tax=Dasania marina TaxID=471499 RepID=UPI0003681B74|nr:porin family protein [Dasania marina]